MYSQSYITIHLHSIRGDVIEQIEQLVVQSVDNYFTGSIPFRRLITAEQCVSVTTLCIKL